MYSVPILDTVKQLHTSSKLKGPLLSLSALPKYHSFSLSLFMSGAASSTLLCGNKKTSDEKTSATDQALAYTQLFSHVFTCKGTVALLVCRWAMVSRSTKIRTPFESITSFTFFCNTQKK